MALPAIDDLRSLFDSLVEGVNVVELLYEGGRAVDCRVIAANRAAERILGISPLAGRRIREILPGVEPTWLAIYQQVEETGEPQRFELRVPELDRWYVVQAVRLGGTHTLGLLFDDVTPRVRREQNQRVLAAVAQDFARLVTEDEITRAIGARLADHLGITTGSVADFADGWATVRASYTGEGAPPAPVRLRVADYIDAQLVAAAEAGETVVLRDVRTDPRVDGERYAALGVGAGVIVPFLQGGEWRHAFSVGAPAARDWRDDEVELLEEVASRFFPRVERARAEEALRASDRRKDDFLALLSHELRNPLAPIRNGLYILERAPAGSDVAERARVVVHRQVDQLVHLVDDLLDVTRIRHGKVHLRLERIDLNEIVARTLDDHRDLLGGVALSFAPAPAPVWVDGDAHRVAQIVSNLLTNAAKFARERVLVQVSADGAVAVVDDGVGMTEEALARVFEPFVQADERPSGGLGLGLTLVRGLAELHGGTAEARSDGPGLGSTFTLRMPRSE